MLTLNNAHSFLVHPAKGLEHQPEISGTKVAKDGKISTMLQGVFDRAPTECEISIVFRPDDSGQQQNPCRSALLEYLENPTVKTGRSVAARLQAVTTHRSRLGLMFLMVGSDEKLSRIVISRFPADEGVVAEENSDQLSVQFIERIF